MRFYRCRACRRGRGQIRMRVTYESGELPHRTRLEECRKLKIALINLLDAGEQTDADQRVAAEREKVVVDSDGAHIQHALPDLHQFGFDLIARSFGWSLRLPFSPPTASVS